ncbi:MAG: hypothetical protein LBJ17_02995 [Dysgonamonadaceae bacterium]|nr:hypothetical protein [Dysgonamonadaceae bacterium]
MINEEDLRDKGLKITTPLKKSLLALHRQAKTTQQATLKKSKDIQELHETKH